MFEKQIIYHLMVSEPGPTLDELKLIMFEYEHLQSLIGGIIERQFGVRVILVHLSVRARLKFARACYRPGSSETSRLLQELRRMQVANA